MNGFICILKPPGMTSSDAVVRVRKKLPRGTKVGHAGTLDPEAAGVLPVMVGKASRLFDYLVDKEKTYVAQLICGYATDTQDAHGQIIAGEGRSATPEMLKAVLPAFIGEIGQIPPMYSALKRDGQKLCDLARQGVALALEPRPTQIYAIDLLHTMPDGSFILRVNCGRGTYIRTLCHDIGAAMGTCAYMGMLLRTQTGAFTLDSAHTIEELDSAEDLSRMLIAMDRPISHLAAVTISGQAEKLVRNGACIPMRLVSGEARKDVPLRVYLEERFAGIGRISEGQLRFDAMLLE